MVRNVSDEELQLKKRARRRLVGAIVLVTAVAVVLPMILDSEPKPATQEINIQIPSPDAGVLSSKALPLQPAAKSPANTETKAEAQAKAEAQSPAKSEVKPEVKPETKPEPVAGKSQSPVVEKKPEPAAEVKKSAPAATQPAPSAAVRPPVKPETGKAADGAFVIQVVALSDAARARELHAKIVAGGLKSYTEVVQTAKGPVTRVRVGPYASREAAEKARRQLQGLGLDGKVAPR